MRLFDKLKWVLIIVVVFVIVFSTNMIDRNIFKSINESIVGIYEDRLVVKNIILDMSTTINKKEVAFLTEDTAFLKTDNDKLTEALKNDLLKFQQTKLTEKEEQTLGLFRQNLQSMLKEEDILLKSNFTNIGDYKKVIEEVNRNLDVLAHIQMQEGKRHLIRSQRSMVTMELFTRLEIYFMIILAVIALIIIFYKPRD